MKFLHDVFIRRPLRFNYLFSVGLDIIMFVSLCFLVTNDSESLDKFKNQSTRLFLILFFYFIASGFYYYLNRQDLDKPLLVSTKFSSHWGITIKTIFIALKYVFQLFILLAIIISLSNNQNVLSPLQSMSIYAISFIILYFLFSKLISFETNRPPIIVVSFILFAVFIILSIGIKNSLFEWGIITFLVVGVGMQFLSSNIKFFLAKSDKNITVDEKLEDELLKYRYHLLLSMPFLYITLFIIEMIMNSNIFIYLFNVFFGSNISATHEIRLLSINFFYTPGAS